MKYVFEFSDKGPVRLQVQEPEGHRVQEIPEVLSSREVCTALKRSRRHIYRYIERQWLHPVVKFSGELFFDAREVQALAVPTRQRRYTLPRRLRILFPDYDLASLQLDRDADLILARILERGDQSDIQWMLRHVPRERCRLFLQTQGHRLLSDRAWRFWRWLWRVPCPAPHPSWRKAGYRLGGTA
ncbi:MAG: hypothetical protein HYZ73_05345 [Elusimicrobia bacterium]|nr:hypothetical protein [Elusimicrobiota bacterium]